MTDYTLEEVIDFINGEIEDAYTEASKESEYAIFDPHGRDYCFKSTSGSSPYSKKYAEIEQKEKKIQDKIMKKAKDFESKRGKEYEIYHGATDNKKHVKDFIKKTRSEGKEPISYDEYRRYVYPSDIPKYKESRQRQMDAFNKLSVSNRLADKAKKGFKNKDVEAKWKKFADKYEETVYDILEAYEYDIISYEAANDYLDMLALFED